MSAFKTSILVQNLTRITNSSRWNTQMRNYAKKPNPKQGIDRRPIPKIEYTAQSIADKGFLRPVKEYEPPKDVANKLQELFSKHLGSNHESTSKLPSDKKYKLLAACFETFQHSVPNSLLHTIETVGDLQKFYATPICTKTPLDKMRNMTLPPNLHVEFEYHRWDPDTDTKFGGITAFPGSSTLVTGLKYKDKYKGHVQEPKLPRYSE